MPEARRIAGRIGVRFDMADDQYAVTSGAPSSISERLARAIIDHPIILLVVWLVLAPGAVFYALSVKSDNSPDRLIVEGDEDYQQTRAFQKIFPEGQYVVVLAEASDPFTPAA